MADYDNNPKMPRVLTPEEQKRLEKDMGWRPEGESLGDLLSDHWFRAGLFKLDADTASDRTNFLDVPGCGPGRGYAAGSRNPHNDCRDAARHALWTAKMAQGQPELALRFTDAYERNGSPIYKEIYMDLNNNRIGIEIGKANPDASDEKLLELISKELLPGGRLIRGLSHVPDTKPGSGSTTPPPKAPEPAAAPPAKAPDAGKK